MSARGSIPGLVSPHPLGSFLPALYRDQDGFAIRLAEGLDVVLAPVLSCLDNLDAYFDPHLVPEDFLAWLAGWLGMELDQSWTLERRRALVAQQAELYRLRGTAAGLAEEARILTGGEIEIEESGGASWSSGQGAPLPGSPDFSLLVRVRVPDPAQVPVDRLEALVAAAKPAHVAHRVEVVGSADGGEESRS